MTSSSTRRARRSAALAAQRASVPGASEPRRPPGRFLQQSSLPKCPYEAAMQPRISDLDPLDNYDDDSPIVRLLLSEVIEGAKRIGLSQRSLKASSTLIRFTRIHNATFHPPAVLEKRYDMDNDGLGDIGDIEGDIKRWWEDDTVREYVLIDDDTWSGVWGSVREDQPKRIRLNYQLMMVPMMSAYRTMIDPTLDLRTGVMAENTLRAFQLRAISTLIHECQHSMRGTLLGPSFTPERFRPWDERLVRDLKPFSESAQIGESSWWLEESIFGGIIRNQEFPFKGRCRHLQVYVVGRNSWWVPENNVVRNLVTGQRPADTLLPLEGVHTSMINMPKDCQQRIADMSEPAVDERPPTPPSFPNRGRSCLLVRCLGDVALVREDEPTSWIPRRLSFGPRGPDA